MLLEPFTQQTQQASIVHGVGNPLSLSTRSLPALYPPSHPPPPIFRCVLQKSTVFNSRPNAIK